VVGTCGCASLNESGLVWALVLLALMKGSRKRACKA
jgi:hypothetical protein